MGLLWTTLRDAVFGSVAAFWTGLLALLGLGG